MTGVGDALKQSAAGVAGKMLAGGATTLGHLRPSPKPLHPKGTLCAGRLRRVGLSVTLGVPWLDLPGDDAVMVRLSRGVGLPLALPDVLGLAVRIPLADGRHGDLLLATTGIGEFSRFLLLPARDPYAATYSTLLPYRSPAGPVLIAATPAPGSPTAGFALSVAVGGRPWVKFAHLALAHTRPSTDEISFDPMTNTLPGLEPYSWVARLREGAYRAARRSRGDERSQP